MIFHLGGILIETEASIPRLGDAYAILSHKLIYDRTLLYRKKVSEPSP